MPNAIRTVVVGSKVGLHARPASLFVQAVGESGHSVTIIKDGQEADGASILAVLAVGVGFGQELEVRVDGDEAERVASELAAMLESDLDA